LNLGLQSALQVVIALLTLMLGLTIHELGHALASVLTGGVVTQIVIFDAHPHVHVLAEAYGATESIRIAAGSGLVLLIWMACAILGWGSSKPLFYKVLSLFAGIELAGWLLACLRLDGAREANDAAEFLACSGMTAFSLIGLVLVVAISGGLIMFFGRHKTQSTAGTPVGGGSSLPNS
jgi:hypothetical protein